jgi:hypothetical protein
MSRSHLRLVCLSALLELKCQHRLCVAGKLTSVQVVQVVQVVQAVQVGRGAGFAWCQI